ncbi:MAG: SIR2 family protein [Flavobacteriales bacterium]|nr:SIR2 family protein [Flavobacteriales bacterium]
MNVRKIFTTNIDNLIPRIYASSQERYITDVTINGASVSDHNSVEYVPIHGCVDHSDPQYVFSAGDLSSSYQNRRNTWEYLRMEVTKRPVIFLGFSYQDSAIVQALYSNNPATTAHRNKWILLREPNPAEQAYFTAIGFNIIVGTVKEVP